METFLSFQLINLAHCSANKTKFLIKRKHKLLPTGLAFLCCHHQRKDLNLLSSAQ